MRLRNIKIVLWGLLIIVISSFAYVISTDRYTNAPFRTMQDFILSKHQVDLKGLRELQASGGPSVDFDDLRDKLSHIKTPILIVDAESRPHGYFNKIPTSFFGYSSHKAIDLRQLVRRLIYTHSLEECFDRIVPEREVAKKYDFGYVNIPIDTGFRVPTGFTDEFITFIESLPKNIWLHFHCRHGKGRTSIMLVMYDIMKNAPEVALQDILKRQYLLGSVDFSDTAVWKFKGTYSNETLERRKNFIEKFYEFIVQRKAGGIQKWSEWRNHRTPR